MLEALQHHQHLLEALLLLAVAAVVLPSLAEENLRRPQLLRASLAYPWLRLLPRKAKVSHFITPTLTTVQCLG